MADAQVPASAVVRSLTSLGFVFVIMAVLLFLPAGTFSWPIGWWFIIAFIGACLVSVAALWWLNPEIFVARSRIQRGTKRQDYIFIILIAIGFLGVLPVAGLDYRFGWSHMPTWVIVLGYVIFVPGFVGQGWSQAVNRHFEPGVRIQEDRGQTVIDTGPYAIMRHPGYTSGALFAISTALMLGSYWALIPALLVGATLVPRTLFEEETLRTELPGYTEYTRRVKWRFVPGVW
ncbi:MAG: isoprenylcysteine carboxylmethyltransferase family protein [Devosia sp.]